VNGKLGDVDNWLRVLLNLGFVPLPQLLIQIYVTFTLFRPTDLSTRLCFPCMQHRSDTLTPSVPMHVMSLQGRERNTHLSVQHNSGVSRRVARAR